MESDEQIVERTFRYGPVAIESFLVGENGGLGVVKTQYGAGSASYSTPPIEMDFRKKDEAGEIDVRITDLAGEQFVVAKTQVSMRQFRVDGRMEEVPTCSIVVRDKEIRSFSVSNAHGFVGVGGRFRAELKGFVRLGDR
jgi:hypothetical protein